MLILQIISIAIAILLGVIVVVRNPGDRNRWLLLIFNGSVASWIASYILADIKGDLALFWNRAVFVAAFSMIVAGYILVASMANRLGRAAIVITSIFIVWLLLILLTPLVVEGISPRLSSENELLGFDVIRGQGYWAYVLSLAGAGIGLVGYVFALSRNAVRHFKAQLRIIFAGFGCMLAVGLTLGVILPSLLGSSAPANFSFLTAFIVMFAFTYAILRQRLFDIRAALARTLGYFLALAAIAIFYVIGIFGLGDLIFDGSANEVALRTYYVGAALFVALTFRPLRNFFSLLTRRVFFRESYVTEEVLSRLTALLVRTVELKSLTQQSAAILQGALRVDRLDLIIKRPGKHDELLASLARAKDWPIVVDELAYHNRGIAEKLVEQKISLVSRLKTSQGIVGYIICGGKLRGDALTAQDIELISVASDELAVAIQNALRFEEISRFNVTLKEEVSEATSELRASNRKLHKLDEAKDEFISMASHQLRTPLTSVKGYLSMVLEGDAGAISPDQRKLLEEAYSSSQRMVYLIGDFLNVSRLQTDKFELETTPVNLARMVRDEVEQLHATALRREIVLYFREPAQFPDLHLDESKMRQVIMNFIDNAIFYSKPGTTVAVELTAGPRDISFAVHDTGIGVPANERHHIFTKFYRASNARQVRPDGTGIGLYMAKKVITAHGGSIIFETKENSGSTFGFRLPLKHEVE